MYSHIGGKIKIVAIAMAELFAIAAILGGVYFLKNGGNVWIGLAMIIIGPFLASRKGIRVLVFYYRGLQNWETEPGYLRDTCGLIQDRSSRYLSIS